jgi:hypothetical protein
VNLEFMSTIGKGNPSSWPSMGRSRNRNGIITTHVDHADVGVAHADYLYLYLYLSTLPPSSLCGVVACSDYLPRYGGVAK